MNWRYIPIAGAVIVAAGIATNCDTKESIPEPPRDELEVVVDDLESNIKKFGELIEKRERTERTRTAALRGIVETTLDETWDDFLSKNPFGISKDTKLSFKIHVDGEQLDTTRELFDYLNNEVSKLEHSLPALTSLFERGQYGELVRGAQNVVPSYLQLLGIRNVAVYGSGMVPALPLATDGQLGHNAWIFSEWETRFGKVSPAYATFSALVDHYNVANEPTSDLGRSPQAEYDLKTIVTFGRNKYQVEANSPWMLRLIVDDDELERLKSGEQTEVNGDHVDLMYLPHGAVLVSGFKFEKGKSYTTVDIGADGNLSDSEAIFNPNDIGIQDRYHSDISAVVELLQSRYKNQQYLFQPTP